MLLLLMISTNYFNSKTLILPLLVMHTSRFDRWFIETIEREREHKFKRINQPPTTSFWIIDVQINYKMVDSRLLNMSSRWFDLCQINSRLKIGFNEKFTFLTRDNIVMCAYIILNFVVRETVNSRSEQKKHTHSISS